MRIKYIVHFIRLLATIIVSVDNSIKSILKITPSTSLVISTFTSTFSFTEYYQIEFKNVTSFGKTVHIKCKNQNINNTNKSFGQLLKIKWLKVRNDN